MDSYLFQKIILLIVETAVVFLGVWVFLANKKNKTNISFLLMSIFVFFWLFFYYNLTVSSEFAGAVVWPKLGYMCVALFFVFFYSFIANLLNLKQRLLGILVTGWWVGNALISISTNLMVRDLVFTDNKFEDLVLGPWSVLYYGGALLTFSLILFLLIQKYLKSSSIEKLKYQYFLVGVFIWVVMNLIFNVGTMLYLNTIKYAPWGNYSVVFFLASTAYAISKHHLMDIRMVVARSVAFMIMMVGIVGFSAGFMMYIPSVLFGPNANNQYSLIMKSVFGVIMVFGFQPFRRFITKITDKIFFKNDYDLHDLIKKITNNAYSTLILIELLYKTIDLLIKEMKATRGLYVLLDKKGNIHTTQSIGYKVTPEISAKDASAFSKHGTLLLDDLSEGSHFKRIFKKLDASIAVGLLNDGVPVGVLFLGEKNSGDMYNTKDIKLFEILAPEMVISIQRAEEHEKVQNFNVFLQSEVARKTKELQEANDHLLELDKAKDEFISMASHQLRTPLTAIKGYLSMLLEGDAGEIKMSQYDFVNEAFSAGNRMVALINDLLNVSRMDTGRFFLEPVTVDLEKIVQEEMKQLSNSAREKKIYLKIEKKSKSLPMITVDETKIRQVIMNFIDNAVYYTVRGGITVILDKDSKNVIFKVQDTGIGVPEKAKNELFTKFFRAENARTARPDGTGLGIYLARKVVEDHGGEIIFDSTEGKGSLFGFKIPIKSKIKKEITSPPEDLVSSTK